MTLNNLVVIPSVSRFSVDCTLEERSLILDCTLEGRRLRLDCTLGERHLYYSLDIERERHVIGLGI